MFSKSHFANEFLKTVSFELEHEKLLNLLLNDEMFTGNLFDRYLQLFFFY